MGGDKWRATRTTAKTMKAKSKTWKQIVITKNLYNEVFKRPVEIVVDPKAGRVAIFKCQFLKGVKIIANGSVSLFAFNEIKEAATSGDDFIFTEDAIIYGNCIVAPSLFAGPKLAGAKNFVFGLPIGPSMVFSNNFLSGPSSYPALEQMKPGKKP